MDEALPAPGKLYLDGLWNEEAALGGRLIVKKPKKFDREEQVKSIVAAFHAIGGDARLAHWANEHPGYFFTKLFTKTLPQQATLQANIGSLNIVYQAAIPPSPLDAQTEIPTDAHFNAVDAIASYGAIDVQSNGESGGTPADATDARPRPSRPAWDASEPSDDAGGGP
jgi:hypothetical protein